MDAKLHVKVGELLQACAKVVTTRLHMIDLQRSLFLILSKNNVSDCLLLYLHNSTTHAFQPGAVCCGWDSELSHLCEQPLGRLGFAAVRARLFRTALLFFPLACWDVPPLPRSNCGTVLAGLRQARKRDAPCRPPCSLGPSCSIRQRFPSSQ